MSWLKGLAGKAEDILNQIDQNAAVALQKEKKEFESALIDVTWDEQQQEGFDVSCDDGRTRFLNEEGGGEMCTENSLLQSELRSLSSEMSQLLQRTKDVEKDNWSLQQQVAGLERELQEARQQTVAAQDLAQGLQLENARLAALQERVASLEAERGELSEVRGELEQYRARAQRILQDKERLITELRGQGPMDDTLEPELRQLRGERDLLRDEAAQVMARLKASRDELQETERRLESGREQASQALQQLQEGLQEERRRRLAAEEEGRGHSEELRATRDELVRQRTRVREREVEVTRLRAQLALPQGDELESRLHALTQTLVQKQSSLETITTEKNALRLQLEKIEHKHRDALALLQQTQSGLGSVNDTDDAKARVPSFLMESPYDTSVARRVKRAYSSLDAVSIRTGVFLRRYPLARTLVVCYIAMLHVWVLVVLLSGTPPS